MALYILAGFILLALYSLALVYLTARVCGKDIQIRKPGPPPTIVHSPQERSRILAQKEQERQDRIDGIDG